MLHHRQGNIDEAFWLVFLSVHFGKNRRTGWRLARDLDGALGTAPIWDWSSVSGDPQAFRRWLAAHRATLEGADGVVRTSAITESIRALMHILTGTGAAVESYVSWVAPPRTHQQLIQHDENAAGPDPRAVFDYLYKSMTRWPPSDGQRNLIT